ncbi:MAG: hypothetical protein HC927_08945 [Deltaproteobacteria bacterium]|nr:hypothetical protein [Deltaproteobacteria bacterium]
MPCRRRLSRILASTIPCVLAGLALPERALAEGPEDADQFTPIYDVQLLGFDDFALDTGWIPGGSPVQMRFYASAANSVKAVLAGDALYDWRDEQLRFVGDPEGGFFEYKVGVELVASVKVDVDLVKWESDLLGPYDYQIDEIAWFTPYLLEGNPDRPVVLSEQSEGFTLVSIPIIPDVVVIAGNLDIDLAVDVEASLQCNRIEVAGPEDMPVFTIEGEQLGMGPGEGPEDLEAQAQLFCQLVTQPTLIVRPHLVLEVLFTEYDIAGIDIPIDLPVVDEEVAFDPLTVSFPRWEEPSDDDGESGGESGEDSGEAGDEGFADEVGESDTGEGPGVGELVDDGCNCSSESSDSPSQRAGFVVLGILVVGAGLRRRPRQ